MRLRSGHQLVLGALVVVVLGVALAGVGTGAVAPLSDEPEFEVDIVYYTDEVDPGDNAVLEVDVENVGDDDGEQTIELLVDDEVVDAEDLALDEGETDTVYLLYPVTGPDADEVDLVVESEDDDASVTVDVPAIDPEVTVDITDYSDTVNYTESISLTAEVENIGSEDANETIEFEVDDELVDTATANLTPGEAETVEFSYETDADDIGNRTLTVSSDDHDDAVEATVTDLDPPAFDIAVTSGQSAETVVEGDPAALIVEVTNTGGVTGMAELNASADDAVLDSATTELEGGVTTSVTLSVDTDQLGPGTHTIELASQDDATVWGIEVLDARHTTLADLDRGTLTPDGLEVVPHASPVQELRIDTGPTDGFLAIHELPNATFDRPAETIDTLTLLGLDAPELPADTPMSMDIEVPLADGVNPDRLVMGQLADGTFELLETEVDSVDGDTATVTANVTSHAYVGVFVDERQPAAFETDTTLDFDPPLTIGDTVTVVTEVENTGDEAGEHTVRVAVGGLVVHTDTVAVEGGNQTTTNATVGLHQHGEVDIAVDGDVVGTVPVEDQLADDEVTPLEAVALALGFVAIGAIAFRRYWWPDT